MWYVYIHFKPNGRPFYVGKGLRVRAFSLARDHNEAHCRIVKKYGAESILVWRKEFSSHDDASREEVRLIAELRAMGVPIVNMTDGGDGTPGFKRSPEQCRANGARKRGNKNMLGVRHSEEAKEKISAALRRHFANPENRKKRSQSLIGKKVSDEFRQKMSMIQSNKRWITDGVRDTKIDKGSLPPRGWKFGVARTGKNKRRKASL